MKIAICGSGGHGKSTVAGLLVKDFAFVRRALADRLKEDVGLMLHPRTEDNPANREQVRQWVNENKKALRSLLQSYGVAKREFVSESYWIDQLFFWLYQNAPEEKDYSWVCDDVRFVNEATAFENDGWIIVKVVDPRKDGPDAAAGFNAEQAKHVSETEMAQIVPDIILLNDGTLDELEAVVPHLVDLVAYSEENHNLSRQTPVPMTLCASTKFAAA